MKNVVTRFFIALDYVVESNDEFRGLQSFTRKHHIDRSILLRLKKETHRKFDPEWLSLIVTKYGISAEWLLTGIGSMLKKKDVKIHHQISTPESEK